MTAQSLPKQEKKELPTHMKFQSLMKSPTSYQNKTINKMKTNPPALRKNGKNNEAPKTDDPDKCALTHTPGYSVQPMNGKLPRSTSGMLKIKSQVISTK